MDCPSCHAPNEEGSENCFTCGRALARVITRGRVISGRYEIQKQLGKGGMGVVYLAYDRVLEEDSAIKVLRADVARSGEVEKRFQREIKLARKVRHRNVCAIHEYGEDEGLRYISMEYVDGVDLRQVLRSRRLPPAEALAVAQQIAEGLHAIHEAGVVHRDLKTPNVMLDSRGTVRLMDFGIAKQVDSETRATATGMIVGTPEYMSPEQARGDRIDARSDLYALGILVFELLTGDVPFRGDTPLATLMKHIGEPPPLSGAAVPEAVKPVLRRCLAKRAEERFASAEEVADALREVRAQVPAARSGETLIESLPAPAAAPTLTTTPTPLPAALPTRPAGSARTPMAMRAPAAAPRTVVETPRVARPAVPASPAAAGPREPAAPPARPGPPVLVLALGGAAIAAAAAILGWLLMQEPAPSPAAAAASAAAPPATVPATTIVERRTPAATTAPGVLPAPALVSAPAATRPAPPPATQPVRAVAAPPAALPAPTLPQPTAPPATMATMAEPVRPPLPARIAPPETAAPAPVPTAEPAAEPGSLLVVVSPWGEVSVDGAARGTTPLARFPLAAGRHTVVVRHPAYQPLERTVTVRSGQPDTLRVDLAAEAKPR